MSLNYKRVKKSSKKEKYAIIIKLISFHTIQFNVLSHSANIATHYLTRTLTLYYAKYAENK